MAQLPRSGANLGSVLQRNLEALVDGPVAHLIRRDILRAGSSALQLRAQVVGTG